MNSLDRMFQPKSIAVIGASNDEGKAGFQMFYALRKFPGALYPINPKASEIQGFKAYPNLKAIGTPVDLIALCIPAKACPAALKEAGEAGVGAALIAGGGFGETGADGQALQDQVLAVAREYGIRLLGPNTAGFVNPAMGVTASFNPLVSNFRAGQVAVVSQSGAMNLILGTVIMTNRMGVSIGVGTGNAPDVGVPEMLEYLADHEPTKSIVVYLEGVEDGRRLYDAVKVATAKKPVIVFTVGQADIGEFAASHTGKLIGSYAIKKAGLKQAGAVVAGSSNDLIDAASILSKVRLAPGENPGVGLLTGQAGPAMIMTDYLRTRGVNIPTMEDATIDRIAQVLPLKTFIKNPVDTARPMHESFMEVMSIMADDPHLDVLAAFAMHEPMCVEPVALFRAIKGRTTKPAVFGTSGLPEDLVPTQRDFETMDLPAFVSPDRTAAAIWALVEDAKGAWRKQRPAEPAPDLGGAAPLTANPDEAQAKALLAQAGIAVPKGAVCPDAASARAAFADMRKPCVVKVLSAAISHKTEVGGVQLNISTDEQLAEALAKIDAIEAPGGKRYLVEEMAPAGLEVIIGGKNDPSFGPVVMLGLGGTAAEALGDVAMRLAPLTEPEALDMIAELKTSALFDSWRGGPAYDKRAVAQTLVRVGAFLAAHPEIKEMDLNPVRVYPQGVLALDALMVIA